VSGNEGRSSPEETRGLSGRRQGPLDVILPCAFLSIASYSHVLVWMSS